ncbi:hypothetical protein BASA62_002159 [Batrachochytrium salamandrivorans]|nr:hypothetical protein BASA62_002159 [Batrachochytrium salamandrivorans]
MELEKPTLAHRHSLDFMKSLVKKVSKHALDKMLEQYKKLADMDDSDECTGLFRTSVGVPCRHEIKRRIEENGRFNIWRYSLSICTCMSHLLLSDDDQTTVVMARLGEASQRSLQSLSNPALGTKRGHPSRVHKAQGNPSEKSHSLEHATGRKCSKCSQSGHNSRTCNVQTSEQQ